MEVPGKDSLFLIDGIEDYTALESVYGYWVFNQNPNEQVPVIFINNKWYAYAYEEHLVELIRTENLTFPHYKMGGLFSANGEEYQVSEPVQGVIIPNNIALILIEEEWKVFYPFVEVTLLKEGNGLSDVFLYQNKNYVVDQIIIPNKLIGRSGEEIVELTYQNGVWNPPVKFQEKPLLTGVKILDQNILLRLDQTSLINFCQTSPFAKEICADENFFREYLTLNPLPVYTPKNFIKLRPLIKTSDAISWKELFMESYKLSQMLKQWDLKKKASWREQQNYKITYEEIRDYVKSLIQKNYIDPLRPYFGYLSADNIGHYITHGGAELGNKEILKLIWDNRFTDPGLRNSLPYHFYQTTPEGADYLMSLGYVPDADINRHIVTAGNLDLLKHMVGLGYQIDERSANWAIINYKLDVLKYLIEEKNVEPSQKHINDFMEPAGRSGDLKIKYELMLDYLLSKGYWSTDFYGIFRAIEKDRPDLLEWISQQPYNNLTRSHESQYKSFVEAAQGKPGVQAWFAAHPWNFWKRS